MLKNKRVIAVIPARAGSKSIINKNIKDLAGKPLIGWSIDIAKSSKYIDRIIVSTDGDLIEKVSLDFGAEVYRRDAHLASDTALVKDCLTDLIERLSTEGEKVDYIVLLEPTSPLRSTKDVDTTIEKLLSFDSVATFSEAELNPHRAWKIINDEVTTFIKGAVPWLPRQQQPKAYQLNGAVYAFTAKCLPKEGSSILFGTIGSVVIPHERAVDIDNELQFLLAEKLIEENNR
ncbi:cytidyltransferase [Vibrio tasmaniensis ZS-17]|uniref:acylneuraminate cytidylyltransferase family protein n=1 Tax=Vibrio TaxID=662 RepID=UPI000316F7ED|nr:MULTISPECIES: acylneuraminate cytidylyltransferase family protein [Vibrio]OED69559.1 cytidyltransferase [Vibrio tasmaniensis ZS-17]PMH99354.1 cytidyltransferase [Vibrio lentus]